MITAAGILVSFVVVIFAFIFAERIKNYNQLELMIRLQIILSTVLMILPIVLISLYYLPATFDIGEKGTPLYKPKVKNYLMLVCPLLGLVSGMIIGIMTEYFTSMNYGPVKGLVQSCKQGAAINIIIGLSIGYLSNIVPTVLIAITVYGSFYIAGMFGIALAAIGMLGNLAICLAIDGYGPISDNAGGLATMCNLPDRVRDETDKLDTAGNTTAAIGKGFAIGSACLVAISLFGAFVTKTHVKLFFKNSAQNRQCYDPYFIYWTYYWRNDSISILSSNHDSCWRCCRSYDKSYKRRFCIPKRTSRT